MTLRNSDLQSDSDLDSIRNSCEVFSLKLFNVFHVDNLRVFRDAGEKGRKARQFPTWDVSRASVDAVVGQNANRTKCQPDIMPTKGWHFVLTFFCGWHFVRPNFLVGILSGPS